MPFQYFDHYPRVKLPKLVFKRWKNPDPYQWEGRHYWPEKVPLYSKPFWFSSVRKLSRPKVMYSIDRIRRKRCGQLDLFDNPILLASL